MKQNSKEPRPIEVAIHSVDGVTVDAAVIITRSAVALPPAEREQWERSPAPADMGLAQLRAALAAILGTARVAVL